MSLSTVSFTTGMLLGSLLLSREEKNQRYMHGNANRKTHARRDALRSGLNDTITFSSPSPNGTRHPDSIFLSVFIYLCAHTAVMIRGHSKKMDCVFLILSMAAALLRGARTAEKTEEHVQLSPAQWRQ